MWLWTPDAASTLLRGHTVVSRVDVLHGGRPVYQLQVVSGQVGIDADRPVRANFAADVVDPTGALTRGDVDDLLNPYDCEIVPSRGVRVRSTTVGSVLAPNAGFGLQPFGTSGFGGIEAAAQVFSRTQRDELAPLGVFGLTARHVSDTSEGLTISLSGQDRAMGYQVPLSGALAIPGGTPVEEAIIRLLGAVNTGVTMLAMVTGFTVGPLLFAPDVDVWAEARKLAQSVGARLFHDRTGQCVLGPAGPPSPTPVRSFVEGGGLLLSVDRAEDSDTIRNVVVAESPDGRIRAVVEDTDRTSPTYAGGRYGRRPRTISSQYFSSVEQAQQAAAARLIYELGRSETVTFTAVPDPGVDGEDVVTVHRPAAGLQHRGLAVAALDVPLAVDQPMRVTGRRSVLAQDGRVLEEPAELAA